MAGFVHTVPTADISSILADVLLVKAKTDNLPASPANEAGLIVDVKAKTDNLPGDPADESLLEAELAKKYSLMDFWSAPADKIAVTDSAADIDFPDIVVSGLPVGATLKRVVLIMTCRSINDTSAADNKINAASKTLRIKKSGGTWGSDDVVGITFDQNSLYCVASTKEAGPTIIGPHDVKGEVDADATYNVRSDQTNRSDAIVALGANLELYDVQVGVRVFFE